MAMMSQQEFYDLADRYLRNEMTTEERVSFEAFCAENPTFSIQLQQHRIFISDMQSVSARMDFKNQLKNVSASYHRSHKHKTQTKETPVVPIQARFKLNIAVAAAVAIISVFSTLWMSGYYTNLEKASTDYSALRRDMNNVKRNVNEHNAALRNIDTKKKDINNKVDSHYGATGFMVTKDGYVVTNFHVINGADSIHLQNNKGDSFRASVIYTDAAKDLAILHINDSNFRKLKSIPYTFKSRSSDLGEDIYTIGFPRDEAVYGQGYLSSATGYAGDTIAYQISIPVNPGNSGGPVLDNKGNIIGIISGKQTGLDGAGFAIKTKILLDALNEIPANSLNGDIVLNKKNSLSNLSRTDQIKQLQDYIYMVKVF
ncbi:trypsin-like peptidase domain-containing protein [Sphingobacterium spiritivorum]|nr:trypsin-like peptidase domain-containing protein [Sphingobacterium spiritivorum]